MSNIDRRQFIIMNRPYKNNNFENITILGNKVLSYHKDLKVLKNNKTILLGHAFSVQGDIQLEDDVLEAKRFWAGRWVLLHNGCVYMDACGTLGCYYATDIENNIYISSSLHLLNDVLGRKEISNYKVEYGDGHGVFDYYPLPYTPFEGVKKLLPSQYIDLGSEETIKPHTNYMIRRYRGCSREWILQQFIKKMSILMQNIEKEFGEEIWITLTGGVDSRTLFAIAQYSNICFKTYTVKRNNTPMWDIKYPLKISKKYGIKHMYIDDTVSYYDEREQVFDTHTCGYVVGTERRQYIAGVDVPIQKKAVVLWGTVWEVYLKYFQQYFNDVGDSVEARMSEIYKVCGDIVKESFVHNKSLEAWFEWIDENPIDGLDWRERMYIEQRVGGWGSSAAQAIDLFDSVRIAPINCQELVELLLSLDCTPGDKTIQKEIVDRCCPKLRNIPYGEPTNILYKCIRKLKKVVKKVCEK